MDERPYPQGTDCVWLASDQVGHLGVFLTAGCGPIPAQTLLATYPLDDIETQILELPKASDIDLLVKWAWADSIVGMVERGFFLYDWSDVHRTEAPIDEYELMAYPYRPLTLDQLPDNLLDAARSVRFTKVAFANAWRVNVRAHMNCKEAYRE